MDPEYSRKLGVKIEELLISQPDTGEQALEIVESLVRSGKIDVIVIERQQRDQQRVGRCHGQRQQDAVEEARDLEPAHQSRGQQDYGAVDHERREAERQHGDREHEANEHRPDQPVEDSDRRGAHECRRPTLDVDAGEHQGEHAQHDGRRNPAEGDPGDAA